MRAKRALPSSRRPSSEPTSTQIDACCVPANAPRAACCYGLGFSEARLQRNGAIVRGRPVDILVFEMKRERWAALRAAHDGSANSIVMPASAKPK